MDIIKAGSGPTIRASSDWVSGTVWQDPIFETPEPARARAVRVRFDPGARTNWHTHPLGQTLYITSGVGRMQVWGGPVREVRPGDAVWIPPHEKHWHGASPEIAMTHIAIHEALDGAVVEWMEPVSDDDYLKDPQ